MVERLKSAPGVAGAYSVRTMRVTSSEGRTDLVAIDQGPKTRRAFRFKKGDEEEIWAGFQGRDLVMVSEPYSYRYGVTVGDTLTLHTDRGLHPFAVRAVFYDYGSDLGVVMMGRATYDRYYDDPGVTGLALYAVPGQDVDALVRSLRQRVTDERMQRRWASA